MKDIVWKKKLVSPFFESHFCLASLSCESLKAWREAYLYPAESLEYENLSSKRRQHAYLLRNHCVKQVVLSCLKKPLLYAKHLHIGKDITNKSILTSDRFYYYHLQISITHSETLGFAIAFEGLYPLGVDIEKITYEKVQSIEAIMTLEEKKLIDIKVQMKERNTVILWTAKESLCKALGGGLNSFSEMTEVLEIFSYDHYSETIFKNFSNYRAYSFLFEDYIITIAFPYPKRFQVDLNKVWKGLKIEMERFYQNHSSVGDQVSPREENGL